MVADVTAKGQAFMRSPVGPLDEWIDQLIPLRSGGQPGRIKSWAVDFFSASTSASTSPAGAPLGPGRTMVSYQINGNKYCERIGRAHKSNHIILVAELYARHHETEGPCDSEARHNAGAGAGAGAGTGAGAGAGALAITGTWHQRCWDPDCARYQSPSRPLPPSLLGALAECFQIT